MSPDTVQAYFFSKIHFHVLLHIASFHCFFLLILVLIKLNIPEKLSIVTNEIIDWYTIIIPDLVSKDATIHK